MQKGSISLEEIAAKHNFVLLDSGVFLRPLGISHPKSFRYDLDFPEPMESAATYLSVLHLIVKNNQGIGSIPEVNDEIKDLIAAVKKRKGECERRVKYWESQGERGYSLVEQRVGQAVHANIALSRMLSSLTHASDAMRKRNLWSNPEVYTPLFELTKAVAVNNPYLYLDSHRAQNQVDEALVASAFLISAEREGNVAIVSNIKRVTQLVRNVTDLSFADYFRPDNALMASAVADYPVSVYCSDRDNCVLFNQLGTNPQKIKAKRYESVRQHFESLGSAFQGKSAVQQRA